MVPPLVPPSPPTYAHAHTHTHTHARLDRWKTQFGPSPTAPLGGETSPLSGSASPERE